MKKLIAMLLALTMLLGLVGCGAAETPATEAPAADAPAAEAPATEAPAEEAVEPVTIEFWYHDGNDISNKYWAEIIAGFEAEYPQYKVNYTALPADSYATKYTTAIATGTGPDILSVRDTDLATMLGLGCLAELTDVISGYAEADAYVEAALQAARDHAYDGGLYCLPMYTTSNICWANTAVMADKGIEVPVTQSDMLALCEEYADPTNNTYFFSLRGGSGSTENIFDWIFTYANVDHLFEEDGTCVLSNPKFAEALDAYASIYWNNWTSADSLTNGFTEMVAEFGSGTSLFIMHNSSSYGQHVTNLGEGNFMNVKPLANDEGITVTKALSYTALAILNSTEKMEATSAFLEYATNAKSSELICSAEGRIPANELVYETEWYTSSEYNAVYTAMAADENIRWLTYPFWLSGFSDFQSSYVWPGLQAVLLKERTSAEVTQEWAEVLTGMQQEYLASLG